MLAVKYGLEDGLSQSSCKFDFTARNNYIHGESVNIRTMYRSEILCGTDSKLRHKSSHESRHALHGSQKYSTYLEPAQTNDIFYIGCMFRMESLKLAQQLH